MWHGMEGIGWGWIGLGILHMIVFWALVILVFLVLLKRLGGSGVNELRAIDILKARYAGGELTREQFDQLKREIGEDGK
jgi:putative membrane protein